MEKLYNQIFSTSLNWHQNVTLFSTAITNSLRAQVALLHGSARWTRCPQP